MMSVFGRGRGRGRGRDLQAEKKLIARFSLAIKLSEGSFENQIGLINSSHQPGPPQEYPLPNSVLSQKNISENSLNKSQSINTIPKHLKPSISIFNLVENMDKLTETEMLLTYPSQIDTIKSEECIEELVDLLCEKALLQPDSGPGIAKLFNAIWVSESMHSLIRKSLLKAIQDKYNKRDPKNRDAFHGLCVLLCELYKLLRLKDLPLKPLTNPICQLLEELLEESKTPSPEDVFYFYQELESVGDIIEKDSPEKMDSIINMARHVAISSTVSPSARCRLLQLIELRAGSWKMSEDIKAIYEDIFMDLIE